MAEDIVMTIKGEDSSKMTYIFNWPVRISIFLKTFCNLIH